MKPVIINAFVACLFAGIFGWLCSIFPSLLIWAIFIGWASYMHSVDSSQASYSNPTCLVFGVVMACLVVFTITRWFPMGHSLTTAITVGIAFFIIVIVSGIMLLSNVAATFFGFAATLAYLAINSSSLTEWNLHNAFIIVSISLLIGNLVGIIHYFISGWLRHYHKFTYYEGDK